MDSIRKEVAQEGEASCCYPAATLIPGAESDLRDAEPDFRGMNLIGYDAMAVGNHEFDNPLTVLRQQVKFPFFPPIFIKKYRRASV